MQTNHRVSHPGRLSRLFLALALMLTALLTLAPATPAQAALAWQIQTVDSAGDVGLNTSLVFDASGNPVISYFDVTNQDLKLAHCGNANCTSGNTFQTVDSAGRVGLDTALALDNSGNPVISYYDITNRDLKLAHCGNATCTSGNSIQTVDSAGTVGSDTALALDSSGNPVISYYDTDNGDLKLVHCGNATCTSGNSIQTVDSTESVGHFTSLKLNSSGNPVISYYELDNRDLKLVHCGNPTCSSGNSITTVDSVGEVGLDTALALDSSGNPVISYYDATNQDLKLAHCGNATCTSGNSITTVDSAGSVGFLPSLALDASGNPIISYRDLTNGDLKLVHCGNANCTSGNTIQTVDSAGNVGFSSSLVLGSNGNPVISYYDLTNGDLKLAKLIETDSTAPVITPVIGGTLGNNGWYTSNVSVSWSVVDAESAISSQTGCDAQSVTTDTAGVTFTCTATSPGGTASQSVTIKRDATAPTISLAARTPANANGWNNSAVTVEWSCSDATSGAVAASVSQTVSSEGAGQSASATCADTAGNSAGATETGINIDTTAPSISAAATSSPNGAGWYNSNVTVQFTCTDALAGVASCPADEVLSSEGAAVVSTAQTITDLAGNSSAPSNIVTVAIDKTAPTISAAATSSPNGAGWYNGDVNVHFTCADALAGVASCPADEVLSSEGAAVASTAQTITDLAGNSSAPSNVVSVAIDKTAPTLNPSVSPNPVRVGQSATASPNATDALSGIASQSCTAPDTATVGSKSVSCTATDTAGNSAGAAAGYQVIYAWSGFFHPVDNLSVLNQVKAGQAIPVKFSLGGNFGLSVIASGYPVSQPIACDSSVPIDDIEQTVTAGASSLSYDAASGQYSYIWKTDKAWATTCRQLIVRLIDGTEHTASFKFK